MMRWALGCCAIVCYMNVIGVIVRATVTNVFCTATLYRGHYCQGPCFCGMVGGHRLKLRLTTVLHCCYLAPEGSAV